MNGLPPGDGETRCRQDDDAKQIKDNGRESHSSSGITKKGFKDSRVIGFKCFFEMDETFGDNSQHFT